MLSAANAMAVEQGRAAPFLRELIEEAGFSSRRIERMGRDPIALELSTEDRRREAAFAGIIRISSAREGLADALEAFERTGVGGEASFGRFSDPARPDDLAALSFPEGDLEVLPDCEVARCKFKLSAESIRTLRGIDWSDPAAGDEFTRMFRREALEYVDAYRAEGADALLHYGDKPEPEKVAEVLGKLIRQFKSLSLHAPDFARYLVEYPDSPPEGVEDSFTWSIVDFGYRPTFTVDQLIIDRSPSPEGIRELVASKTIYANHYLAGRIQVGAIVDGEAALGVPGSFLLLEDRIRFDDELGGIKRGLMSRGLSSDLRKRLVRMRAMAEGAP